MRLNKAIADEDGDGIGEYGTFAELCGAMPICGTDRRLNPPVLSRAFGQLDPAGHVVRDGYVYALYLPRAGGEGATERSGAGIAAGTLDPNLAETQWLVYAWPEEYGRTGTKTFAVTAAGEIVSTEEAAWSGKDGPPAEAAIRQESWQGRTIVGRLGTEGEAEGDCAWEATDPIDSFLFRLQEGAADQRRHAASGLAWRTRRMTDPTPVYDALVQALRDPVAGVRLAAIGAMSKAPAARLSDVLPPIIERESEDERIVEMAVRILAFRAGEIEGAEDLITRLLEDDRDAVRIAARRALDRIQRR